jgi:hypothetical protein
MPVDQTGENILFVLANGQVEAHIQIQYDGDPDQFAWVIPIPKAPEVEVGSQQLFTNMLDATVPTYQLDRTNLGCGTSGGGGGGSGGCGFGMAAQDWNNGGAGDDGFGEEPPEDGPDVIDRGFAGAFQYAVLQGGSIDGVTDWLDLAGFAQDEDAPPILEEYLDEDFLFLAVKLRSGAGVQEIQPLVVRYDGDEPCVPIRLTRIAAVDDMGIRAFFLGGERTVPKNYKHVTLNQFKLEWTPVPGENYESVVTQAVDEAGGHAFVTEYAGENPIGTVGLRNDAWDPEAFVSLEVTDVVTELTSQGLMQCDAFGCQTGHDQVVGLLSQYVPVPDGLNADAFYLCLTCFEQFIDEEAWDGQAFADAMQERIVDPGEHALGLINQNPYLTRLYTTLSPHEMTQDPLFHARAGLDEVSEFRTADRKFACEGPDWIEMEDGRYVALDTDSGNAQPFFEDMPFAETIESIPAAGATVVEVDNRPAIDGILDAWNAARPLFVEEGDEDELPDGAATPNEDGGLCACRDTKDQRGGMLYMAALAGIIVSIRRRRRR